MKVAKVCIGVLLGGVLATAQVAVSWVASTGNDGNTCVRTAPCRTFAGAYQKTSAGGTIHTVDAADYGPVSISKAITIDGSGTDAVILAPFPANGVSISNLGPSDQVTLRHLRIYTDLSVNFVTVYGVLFTNGSTAVVNLEDVTIVLPSNSGGTQIGVGFLNGGAVNSLFTALHLSNVSIVGGNTGVNLLVGTTSIEHLQVTGAAIGLSVSNCSVTVRDSAFRYALFGVSVSASTATTSALLDRSEMSFSSTGLSVNGASSTVRIADSVITGNTTGISQTGGTLISFRTNMIAGNNTDGTSPLSTSLK